MNTQDSDTVLLEVWVSAELQQAAMQVAQITGTDISALVARGLAREIEEVQSQFGTLWLSEDRYNQFLKMADEVRPISPKLSKAALDSGSDGSTR